MNRGGNWSGSEKRTWWRDREGRVVYEGVMGKIVGLDLLH